MPPCFAVLRILIPSGRMARRKGLRSHSWRSASLLAALTTIILLHIAPKQAWAKASVGSEAEPGADAFSHVGQFGLRVGLALPFKVNFRFDDSPPCDINADGQDKKVCPIAAPLAVDLALTYGLSGMLEPFVWARFGLASESQTNTAAATVLGAGLRLYTARDAPLKVFLEPSVGAELEGALRPLPGRNYDTDVLARLHFGGQYDFTPNFGGFLTLGPNVSFVRALSLGLELTFGLHARLP